MLMVFKGVEQEYVYIADTEYDQMRLIQSAGLVFKRVDDRNDIYQLAFSFNYYLKKHKVNRYVEAYTGITSQFLVENGLTKEEFIFLYDDMFEGIKPEDVLFVSHGVHGDKKAIEDAEVSFIPENFYCTFKNAKRLLGRDKRLSLADIAEEAGYMLQNSHDAYADAIATAVALSFLTKVEWQIMQNLD
jgi:DNA polymerase III epsilon subunit-like protein